MDKKREILSNIGKTYCRLQPSDISGVGTFAIRDIPKGINPFRVINKEKWFMFKKEELKGLDGSLMDMIKDFYVIEKNGSAWISDFVLNGINLSYFVNHSKKPNLKRVFSGEFVTLRKIKKGEELTVVYSTFDPTYERFDG